MRAWQLWSAWIRAARAGQPETRPVRQQRSLRVRGAPLPTRALCMRAPLSTAAAAMAATGDGIQKLLAAETAAGGIVSEARKVGDLGLPLWGLHGNTARLAPAGHGRGRTSDPWIELKAV